MHTPQQTPEWIHKNPDEINNWQRLAIASRGVATPGNIISVLGLLTVLYGAIVLYRGDWIPALVFIAVGRLADLVDGYVAQHTGTKSRLGEAVDTTCDKVGVFVVAVLATLSHAIPWYIIAPIALYHVYLALFAVIWGGRYSLHTTRFGKFAMVASWLVLLAAVINVHVSNVLTLILVSVSGALFAALALASIYAYSQALRDVINTSDVLAPWTQEVTAVVHIYNPRASNYQRAENAFAQICSKAGWKPHRFNVKKQQAAIETCIRSLAPSQTVLVTISGGDGTVSGVINKLALLQATASLPKIYVLPLWGGNANDFSFMLNGLYGFGNTTRLLSSAQPAALPLIRLEISRKKQRQIKYACCYASFGASAFAAHQLESRRFSTSSMLRWVPPLLVVRELAFVIRALLESPMHVAEINRKETSFYEHTLINGSRIAKVNRIPVRIDEPVFFHALVERKHPSLIITLMRIILRQPDTVYAKKSSLQFTTKQSLDAQIDGEVVHFDKDTEITAQIVQPNGLFFISTSLASKTS